MKAKFIYNDPDVILCEDDEVVNHFKIGFIYDYSIKPFKGVTSDPNPNEVLYNVYITPDKYIQCTELYFNNHFLPESI